ncbi:MAG: PASTA domain-containing protein, partial [Myxococcota bacterium]
RSRNEPPRAAVAAPPARPAAPTSVAAGRNLVPAVSPEDAFDLVFVPDFEGTTMARARRIAANESLEITTLGAIEGRVVSQFPVPGTVLEGGDRTVRLRFEQRRPALARREEG